MQYFPAPEGNIQSFGFESGSYPPDLKYRICIERDPKTQCIIYTKNTFDLDDQTYDPPLDINCDIYKDYLFVPNTIEINGPYFCRDQFGLGGDATRGKHSK